MSTPSHRALRAAREAEGYQELGLYEEVLERAEQLLELGELLDVAALMRAEGLRGLGRFTEGANAFEKVLELDPDNVHGYVGLGWCLKRSGRLPDARRAMERLLVVRPAEPIGLFNLACYCALAGDEERALALLARAIEIDPDYRALAREEEDLAGLRGDPEFERLL